MDKLNFNWNIYTPDNNDSFYGIANVKDTEKDEQYIGKFFLKPSEEHHHTRLYFDQAPISLMKDYENLSQNITDIEVKNQIIDQDVVNYRVKTFLHFGSQGFITQDDARKGPSVLLTHLMNETTTTDNPNYVDIHIPPSYPEPYVPPIIPTPTTQVDLIVIDDVIIF